MPRPKPGSTSERRGSQQDQGGRAWRVNQYDEMRTKIGTKAGEFEPAKEEIAANFKKIDERLNNLTNAVNAAVQKAQQNGAQGPELEDAKQNVQKAIASFRSEPNKTYISSLDRHRRADGEPGALDDRAVAQLREREAEPRVGHERRQDSKSTFRPRPPPTARPTL